MNKPFLRKDLDFKSLNILHRGQWANADLFLFRQNGDEWAIKDFYPCPWLVRQTFGRLMVRREMLALQRLQGIHGIAETSFQLDEFALCYSFMPGTTLKQAKKEGRKPACPDYFIALEKIVRQMHNRNVTHLDLRNLKNIILTDKNEPAIVDFQSCMMLDRVPRCFHELLKDIDLSGVYKCWYKISPETLDKDRADHLKTMNKKRRLWILKGYPLKKLFEKSKTGRQ